MYPNYVYGLQWNKDKKATKEKSRNGGEDTDDENLLVPRARLVGPELAQPPAQLPPHPQPPPRTSRGLRATTTSSILGDSTAFRLDDFASHFTYLHSEDQRAVSGAHAQYSSVYGVRTFDYVPNGHLSRPSYQAPPTFDSSIPKVIEHARFLRVSCYHVNSFLIALAPVFPQPSDVYHPYVCLRTR